MYICNEFATYLEEDVGDENECPIKFLESKGSNNIFFKLASENLSITAIHEPSERIYI